MVGKYEMSQFKIWGRKGGGGQIPVSSALPFVLFTFSTDGMMYTLLWAIY